MTPPLIMYLTCLSLNLQAGSDVERDFCRAIDEILLSIGKQMFACSEYNK